MGFGLFIIMVMLVGDIRVVMGVLRRWWSWLMRL